LGAISFAAYRLISDAPDEELSFVWDKYDMSLERNQSVSHLQMWSVTTSGTFSTLALDSIPVTDTTCTFMWPADGNTYLFAMVAVAPNVSSEISNVVQVEMPDKRRPLSITGLRRVQ